MEAVTTPQEAERAAHYRLEQARMAMLRLILRTWGDPAELREELELASLEFCAAMDEWGWAYDALQAETARA